MLSFSEALISTVVDPSKRWGALCALLFSFLSKKLNCVRMHLILFGDSSLHLLAFNVFMAGQVSIRTTTVIWSARWVFAAVLRERFLPRDHRISILVVLYCENLSKLITNILCFRTMFSMTLLSHGGMILLKF